MNKFLLSLLFTCFYTSVFAETSIVRNLPSDQFEGLKEMSQQKESVVCVHAFLRSYKSLKPIANTLEKENYDVFIWNYETRKFTLEEHANHLNKLLRKIAETKPGVPINFVTHSVGGVIVRVALSKEDCPIEAKQGKAVLMAPPNAGSALARRYNSFFLVRFVFGNKLGRQLLTYTPEKMLNIAKIPPSVDVLVLSGRKNSKLYLFKLDEENDGKVCTQETRLDTPHKIYTVNANHTYIITDRKAFFIVKEFLKYGNTTPVIQAGPEIIEQQIKQNEETATRLNTSQNRGVYIIHCFGSHPQNLYGFPKNWKAKP